MAGPEATMIFPTGSNPTKSAKARGFTLIELILVMAMLLIVLAVSAPALSNFFRGRTLDSEARRFLSLTRYGQSRAVSEGVPMILWIDAKNGTYGLEEEASYAAVDPKAVELELGKDLQVEVADLGAGRVSSSRANRRQRPEIRFLPDGFIDERSPQSVVLREGDEPPIWITQSLNGLNYEIETNRVPLVRR